MSVPHADEIRSQGPGATSEIKLADRGGGNVIATPSTLAQCGELITALYRRLERQEKLLRDLADVVRPLIEEHNKQLGG